ncbi:MAG: Gldg family protein [Deltaproteobacteria bacterium]|nr:Gldg family protein [Deltaproteobacteria bacterium]
MDRWIRFSGVVGLVVFGFGFIGGLLIGDLLNPFLVLHMTLGFALVLTWLFGYGLRNMSEAGQAIRGRTARFGANALAYTVVFAGLLGVLNYLAGKFNVRWDLTEENVYSLSPQSEEIVEGLDKPLLLVAFKGTPQVDEVALADLFKLYEHANPSMVKAQVVDPRSKPHLIDQYEMKAPNKIYVEYGEGDAKAVSRLNDVTEQEISNAILKLKRGAAKKIYYIEGHDEPALEGMGADGLKRFADSITDEHLEMAGLLLADKDSVPQDAAAVILVSPKKPLLPEEKQVLIKYVEEGGRLIMFADPRTTGDIKELAAHFHIEVGNDVVIDQVQRLFAAPVLGAQPYVRDYTAHPVTKGLTTKHLTVFNIASTVKPASSVPQGATVTELIKTGTSSWAESDLARLFDQNEAEAEFNPGQDVGGPVSLAASYEKTLKQEDSQTDPAQQARFAKHSRVVVFGDSDFILNANIGVYANRDLALKAVNWGVGEEGGLSLPSKTRKGARDPIESDVFVALLGWGLVVPELILLFGLAVWWRRKTALA